MSDETRHDGTCEPLIDTRIKVAKLEEKINILPEIKEAVEKLCSKVDKQKGFIAGISATVSAIITLIGLVLQWKGMGK